MDVVDVTWILDAVDDALKVVHRVDVKPAEMEGVTWILDAVDDALKVVHSVDVLKGVASWDTVSKVTDLI